MGLGKMMMSAASAAFTGRHRDSDSSVGVSDKEMTEGKAKFKEGLEELIEHHISIEKVLLVCLAGPPLTCLHQKRKQKELPSVVLLYQFRKFVFGFDISQSSKGKVVRSMAASYKCTNRAEQARAFSNIAERGAVCRLSKLHLALL